MENCFKNFNSKIDLDNNVIYVFIDSSNLWAAQKSKGKMFDYEKLIKYIKEKFNLTNIKIFYYTAYPADGTRDYNLDGKHRFYTFLKKGLVCLSGSICNIFSGLSPSSTLCCIS